MNRKQNSLMRFSRTERLAQLSEQEIVIERKKREIQAKIEAQKKKETEEALRKLESSNNSKNNKPGFSKKSFSKRDDCHKDKDKEKPVEDKKVVLTNAFSNDGSFLDQFKKLSQTGLAPSNVEFQTLAKARKKEEEKLRNQEKDERESSRQRRAQEQIDGYRDKERNHEREFHEQNQTNNDQKTNDTSSASGRKPLDSNIQLQLPPPGVVQLVPQHQVQIVSLVQPVTPNPVPLVQQPQPQLTNLQPVVLNPVQPFTTNEIQLKAISSPSLTEIQQAMPIVQVPNMQMMVPTLMISEENKPPAETVATNVNSQPPPATQLSSIQPPLPMTPQNIPPPSPIQVQNIPPPPLPPKEPEQFPKFRSEGISITLKNNNTRKLELKPLDFDEIPSPPPGKEEPFSFSERKKEKNEQSSVSSGQYFDSIPLPGNISSQDEESSRLSSALNDDEDRGEDGAEGDKYHHLAKMVAQCGDDVEDLLRKRNEDDPSLRFLFDQNCQEYVSYRKLVQKYRRKFKQVEDKSEKSETKSHSSSSSEDNSDNEDQSWPKMSGNKDISINRDTSNVNVIKAESNVDTSKRCTGIEQEPKFNDGYQADNEEELPYYKMPEASSKEISFLPSHIGNSGEKSETTKEETTEQAKAEERRKRKRKSRWGDAVATPSSVPVPGVSPNLAIQPPGKLPVPKTTLLSQLTRSDPGLIQYARQTFGSTNLSEEDWKKAEDHYKINLLYQDMVKKRAEIDKLEKAGKFKYEYDSDEDVEGGTWEHKLRQQEMMATQLWAEELTRQAAGKHHIGDFLPPEELERFMEKYNAVKEGREPDLSDYKEFKLKEDNVGYRLLQKMGWNEGQGLGQDGSGITNPVNKATTRHENQGLGIERPDGLEPGDDEYDAYRKRMMLAYRFRPNPLNNPRRPYY